MAENDYTYNTCPDGSPSGRGLHVFGHPAGGWVGTRPIFNQHSYHITHIHDDATVPRGEPPHFATPATNSFRAQASLPSGSAGDDVCDS